MSKEALSGRGNWQNIGGRKASVAEKTFFSVFTKHFEGTEFRIRAKPKEFRSIYSQIALHETILNTIYTPDNQKWVAGMIPDYAIDNVRNKKTLYVEVKRQDGWVEGKGRQAGRGNVHERMCKYFTPGLLKILRGIGNLGPTALPFWIVFQGDIARDPVRVREITCWFDTYTDHFHMWCNSDNPDPLLEHFDSRLKQLLL